MTNSIPRPSITSNTADVEHLIAFSSRAPAGRIAIVCNALDGPDYDFDSVLATIRIVTELAEQVDDKVKITLGAFIAGNPDLGYLEAELHGLGVSIEVMDRPTAPLEMSFVVQRWLVAGGFTLVVALDNGEALYWPSISRATGQSLVGVRLVQVLRAPTLFDHEVRGAFVSSSAAYSRDWVERKTCGLVDRVFVLERGLWDWLNGRDWPTDNIVHVLPGWPRVPPPLKWPIAAADGGLTLAFVGNLDERYGLQWFLDAVTDLALKVGFKEVGRVTILGVPGSAIIKHAATLLAETMSTWGLPCTVRRARSPLEVFSQLNPANSLVVTCGGLSGGEMIGPICEAYGFAHWSPLIPPASEYVYKSPFEVRDAKRVFGGLKEAISAFRETDRPGPRATPSSLGSSIIETPRPAPMAMHDSAGSHVIVAHRNNPIGLALTLKSLWNYPINELTVVDNSLGGIELDAYFDELQLLLTSRGWRLRRGTEDEPVTLMDLRELAPAESLILVWAADELLPDQINKLCGPILRDVADLTTGLRGLVEDGDIDLDTVDTQIHGTPVAAIYTNVFGTAPIAIRSSLLDRSKASQIDPAGEDARWLIATVLTLEGARFLPVPRCVVAPANVLAGQSSAGPASNNFLRDAKFTARLADHLPRSLQDLLKLTRDQYFSIITRGGESHWPPQYASAHGDAVRRPMRGVDRALAVADLAEETGRPETAIAALMSLPTTHWSQDTNLCVRLARYLHSLPDADALAVWQDKVFQLSLPPSAVAKTLTSLAIEQSRSGAWPQAERSLDQLETLDLSRPDIERFLSSQTLVRIPPGSQDERLARLSLSPRRKALEAMILRSLLAMSARSPAVASAWKKRLSAISVGI